MLAGDDRLDAGDLRTGLRLLANGGFSVASEVAALEQERRGEGVPPMFEDAVEAPRPTRGVGGGGRRGSVWAEMLTPHETSQVRISDLDLMDPKNHISRNNSEFNSEAFSGLWLPLDMIYSSPFLSIW